MMEWWMFVCNCWTNAEIWLAEHNIVGSMRYSEISFSQEGTTRIFKRLFSKKRYSFQCRCIRKHIIRQILSIWKWIFCKTKASTSKQIYGEMGKTLRNMSNFVENCLFFDFIEPANSQEFSLNLLNIANITIIATIQ